MKSMTGFGEGEAGGEMGSCRVQVQSVNSRYAKIGVNLSREFASLEDELRKFTQKRVGRGKVSVSVSLTPAGGTVERVTIDRNACRDLAAQMKKVQGWLGLEGPLDMRVLVNTGAVVKRETVRVSRRSAGLLLRKALSSACGELAASQEREGRVLFRDLMKRWRKIDSLTAKIDALRPRAQRRYEERLRTKVRTVLEGAQYDRDRLLAEVSIYADRVDITEEIVRLGAHLKNFRRLLVSRGEVGKKLDFTVQEILREVNTCANKANDARISRVVIEIKAELEKIREQLQNVQ